MSIQKELDNLEESRVKNVYFDLLAKKIVFDLRSYAAGETKLIFHDVSSYYFLKGYGKFRFDIEEPEPGEYMELTAVGFNEDGFGKLIFDSEKFGRVLLEPGNVYREPIYSSANFALELWASYLFIEAKGVTIGDKFFEVGPPKKYSY
jgi:hypothetical protein